MSWYLDLATGVTDSMSVDGIATCLRGYHPVEIVDPRRPWGRMPDEYVTMKGQLPAAAAQVWQDFLNKEGITLGAFLEAAATLYAEGATPMLYHDGTASEVGIGGHTVVLRAREIVAERRRRTSY